MASTGKKSKGYPIALGVYSAVLIAAVAAGLLVLRSFLVAYEASRPDGAVEAFMAEKDRSFWIDGAQGAISGGFNEFSDLGATVAEYGLDVEGEISWRGAGGGDAEKYYDVRMGASRFARLTLTQDADVGFGMYSWKVSDCSFSPGSDTTVTIAVPEGCTARINGVTVSSEYLSGKGELEVETEHGFDKKPVSDVYVVDGLRGPVELKGFDASGGELEPFEMGENEVHFLPEPVYSMSFYARPDAEVYINGSAITGEYCVAEGEDIFDGVSVLRYECTGLYREPEISVVYGGEEARPAQLGLGLCYVPDAGAELDAEKREFIEAFMRAYTVFSTNYLNTTHGNFFELSKLLLPDTKFYEAMSETRNTIIWVESSAITYDSIECYDYIPMSDGSFLCFVSCRTTVRMTVQMTTRDQQFDTTSVLVVVPYAGEYRVAGMSTEL